MFFTNGHITSVKNTTHKIVLPFCDDFAKHVFHLFVIRTENREHLQEYLKKNSIETLIHYPIPPHKQNALTEWNDLYFPITENISAASFSTNKERFAFGLTKIP